MENTLSLCYKERKTLNHFWQWTGINDYFSQLLKLLFWFHKRWSRSCTIQTTVNLLDFFCYCIYIFFICFFYTWWCSRLLCSLLGGCSWQCSEEHDVPGITPKTSACQVHVLQYFQLLTLLYSEEWLITFIHWYKIWYNQSSLIFWNLSNFKGLFTYFSLKGL